MGRGEVVLGRDIDVVDDQGLSMCFRCIGRDSRLTISQGLLAFPFGRKGG